jgi:hypothetical protein
MARRAVCTLVQAPPTDGRQAPAIGPPGPDEPVHQHHRVGQAARARQVDRRSLGGRHPDGVSFGDECRVKEATPDTETPDPWDVRARRNGQLDVVVGTRQGQSAELDRTDDGDDGARQEQPGGRHDAQRVRHLDVGAGVDVAEEALPRRAPKLPRTEPALGDHGGIVKHSAAEAGGSARLDVHGGQVPERACVAQRPSRGDIECRAAVGSTGGDATTNRQSTPCTSGARPESGRPP